MLALLFGATLWLAGRVETVLAQGPTEVRACEGSHVLENIAMIGLTTKALHLLNGREDPKLVRVLEGQLKLEASGAKATLERGAVASSYPALLSLSHGVQDAAAYASDHHLGGSVSDDLRVLEKWVTKQLSDLSAASR